MTRGNPPILLALVLCDTTIREEGTHKLTLIGIFNGLFAPSFPCVHPSLSVYVALTDGRGEVPCRLRMTYLETGQEVFSLTGSVHFQDPTGVSELVFLLQQLRLEQAGDYSVEFFAESEMLGSRKLRVQPAERKRN